ncbi:cysteine--tRNA ligase [Vaccinium witches'-broom phytoplasma]|uniref:cysteine--tRNA ligase n=1 Tax=Vaccinium witches'-broom phytoplasma TaxID=85642 RepID=UPI00036F81D1|nr:cysteine--tRNA ligase [Vaccinium witches'-broom phytoplasma]
MLKIYNSLTQKKENFTLLNENEVNIYVCGPTVYDHLHIGNIKPLIFFDMMKRYFTLLDFNVKLVVNITDVDDKIIQTALANDATEAQISQHYIQAFFTLLKKLDIDTIDKFPLVTNYIKSIIIFIQDLIQKGYAYLTSKGVYFRVNLIDNYGSLSKQDLTKLKKNTRKELDPQKENVEDFILWKKTDTGVQYESPWCLGRPGWHTECVVMIKDIFKTTIDIHGGGNDLKFPHHENEQAQFLASQTKPLTNFFVHIGRVDYQKQKMSKSLNNVVLAKDVLKDFEANVIKFFFLSHHYLQPINFSYELLLPIQTKYHKIVYTLNKNNFQLKMNHTKTSSKKLAYLQQFHQLMQNDFDTPNVVTLIDQIIKELNKTYVLTEMSELQNTLLYLFQHLGISLPLKNITPQDVTLYQKWLQARQNKDFKQADLLRKLLEEKSFI